MYTYICISCIYICLSACQSIWHSKYVYYVSNIEIIHAKNKYKIVFSVMLYTSIDVKNLYLLSDHSKSSR